jgi:hypothetical protein
MWKCKAHLPPENVFAKFKLRTLTFVLLLFVGGGGLLMQGDTYLVSKSGGKSEYVSPFRQRSVTVQPKIENGPAD